MISDTVTKMITHDAAPVPFPPTSPPRMPRSVGSSEATTIPIHKAEPTKKTSRRQTKDLNAGGKILRGFSVSAATMAMYSGPVMLREISLLVEFAIWNCGKTYLKLAWYRQERTPKNFPVPPGARCSTKAPGLFQKRNL